MSIPGKKLEVGNCRCRKECSAVSFLFKFGSFQPHLVAWRKQVLFQSRTEKRIKASTFENVIFKEKKDDEFPQMANKSYLSGSVPLAMLCQLQVYKSLFEGGSYVF